MNQTWVDYCVQFHTYQDYFECHEILEEHWKENEQKTKKDIWVGFISLAVALYHQRNENYSGATKLLKMAQAVFTEKKDELHTLYIDKEAFFSEMQQLTHSIHLKKPYKPVLLPLQEDFLTYLTANEQFVFMKDPIDDFFLKNKHTLRDRSDVIEARKTALQKRRMQS